MLCLVLITAAQALKEGKIDGLVTAPIHKKNTQSEEFNFTGHTPYLKNLFWRTRCGHVYGG